MKHIKQIIHRYLEYIAPGPRIKILSTIARGTAAAAVCIYTLLSVLAPQHPAQTRQIWRSNGPFTNIKRVVVDPHNTNIVYAGGPAGIFKSLTNGTNWLSVAQVSVEDLSLDHVNPGTIYAAGPGGVLKSTDGGMTWKVLNTPLPEAPWKVQVSTVDPNLIAVADRRNNIATTTNGGASWTIHPFPVPELFPETLAFGPNDPMIIYTYVFNNDDIALLKSINGGQYWGEFDYGNVVASTQTFEIDPHDQNVVSALGYGGSNSRGLYKTINSGTNWSYSAIPGAQNYRSALAIDPLNPKNLYVGAGDVNSDAVVYRSADDGATWDDFSTGLNTRLIPDMEFDRCGRFLYAATSTGVYSTRIRGDSTRCTRTYDRQTVTSQGTGSLTLSAP